MQANSLFWFLFPISISVLLLLILLFLLRFLSLILISVLFHNFLIFCDYCNYLQHFRNTCIHIKMVQKNVFAFAWQRNLAPKTTLAGSIGQTVEVNWWQQQRRYHLLAVQIKRSLVKTELALILKFQPSLCLCLHTVHSINQSINLYLKCKRFTF